MLKARVGKPAPPFGGKAVIDFSFKEMHSSDFEGSYIVLFIYSSDFGYVCPTEVCAMNDAAGDFQALDCHVIVASTDSHYVHFAWINTPREKGGLGQLQIPILSDLTQSIGKAYGAFDDEIGCHLRGTFIIDRKGVLRHASVSDLTVGRDPDELLRLVQALQHVDATGQLCPVNWKPGMPTVKPDMRQKMEYFEAIYLTDEERAEEAEKEAKRKAKEAKAKAKELEKAQASTDATPPAPAPAQDVVVVPASTEIASAATTAPSVSANPANEASAQPAPSQAQPEVGTSSAATLSSAEVLPAAPTQPDVTMVDVGTQVLVTSESGTQTSSETLASPNSTAVESSTVTPPVSNPTPGSRAGSAANKSKACLIL